jgi:hypothetical protein
MRSSLIGSHHVSECWSVGVLDAILDDQPPQHRQYLPGLGTQSANGR